MRTFLTLCSLVAIAGNVAAQLDWNRGPGAWRLPIEAGYAFDESRGQLVVFGGTLSFQALDVTWLWDGATWTRLALSPAPSARNRPVMVWDPDRAQIVLFGGIDANGTFLDDTWTFDGQAWSRLTTRGSPTAAAGSAIAYDPVRREVVVHGGFTGATQVHGETWALSGTTWTRRSPVASPGPRAAHRMLWHPDSGEIVLHGGVDPVRNRTLADTWTWDGQNWIDRTVANRGPGSLCDQLLVWDAARRRMTHWGGLRIAGQTQTPLGDVFEFDGRNWNARTTGATVPGPRAFPYGAYVPASQAIEVGAGLAGTTTFTDWWQLAPVSPARILPVGPGCAGTNGVPGIEHAPGELPWLDSTFELRVTNLPANGPVAMNIGLSDTSWPLGPLPYDLSWLGITGCSLRTSIELAVGVPRQGSTGRFVGAVCDCPAALGLSFYLQAVAADPAVNRPLPVTLSDAVEGVVGAR